MIKFLDLHCDTVTKCMDNNAQIMENQFQNSFSGLLNYQSPIQVFAVYTDNPYLHKTYEYTTQAIDFYYSQTEKYKDYAKIFDPENICNSKVNCILAIEGGEPVDSKERLWEFIEKGVKILTLTWNRKNPLGCGALSGYEEGLTELGKYVLTQNIIPDVSHLNEQGFRDVVKYSQRPFIASHSNAYSIHSHKRNLKDWQIKEISQAGGITGINIYPPFIGEKGDIVQLLRHIEHILDIDENILCLGCDLDGISRAMTGIENVTDMKKVYDIISDKFGKTIADKIFFNNGYDFLIRNKDIFI